MKAAIVEDFDRVPEYGDFACPTPEPAEALIEVRAAALSQLVRAQASGRHYSSGVPPFVPGADGVGRLDGRRVYFAFPRGPVGAMAQQVAVARANIIELPDDVDDVTAAAIANPGMSSWAALTTRAGFQPGESVLINGATGTSGRLAIRIARHLGARHIVATGRTRESAQALLSLGADEYIALENDDASLEARFRQAIETGIDVVLDYLWGPPAAALLAAATGHGQSEAARRIRFINIGSLAGATLDLPASTLRSSGVELLGSGLGSVSHADLVQSIAGVFAAVTPAGLSVDAQALPLTEVARHWAEDGSNRLVFTLD